MIAIRYALMFLILLFGLPTYKALGTDASILPQGVTQFLDDDGNPLSSGKVYFYVPTTFSFKTTWQNAAKSITNTNPVDLDAGGRAIIYGDGAYRQIVKDSAGNTIYDAVTTAPLTGGSVSLIGDGNAVATVLPWAGLVPPSQYVFGYGQEVARVTYPELLAATTTTQSVICTLGSPTITGLSDTSQLIAGTRVELSCVAAGTTVLSKTLTTVTLSANSSANTTASAIFFPWGNGNGSTTFNVPDLRGYNLAGRDNMGGTASARLINGNGLGRPLGIANFTYVATASQTNSTFQTFTSGSASTYITPVGATKIIVTMTAGGGGGGAVTTNAGAVGTDSSWVISGGTNWTAIHGNGGTIAISATFGIGGTGGTDGSTGIKIFRIAGGTGTGGENVNNANGGMGGSTIYGGGGGGAGGNAFGATGAAAAANTGSGGGGGTQGGAAGGGGGGAGETVQFSITSPLATYTYTVGAGGNGGAAGGGTGGNGGNGNIIVEEQYAATPTPVSTSFTATTAGTLEKQTTINYVVKISPDTSISVGNVVNSLGGMTGIITCGTGVTCSGNDISASIGSGTVTSVAFSVPGSSIFGVTGSPVTTIGTLGLTTTGTSGGIPYFSSVNILSTSAVLTANLPVIGGGAGVAPSVGTRSGNTTKFVSTTGTLTSGRCAEWDASGNLIQASGVCSTGVTPSALTRVDDTNITLTLGGTPATALLQATSLTLGWTGTLAVARGGTGAGTFTANLPLIGNGTSAIAQGTRSGNTTSFATTTGVLTSGDCVSIDANGNLVAAGGACTTGGGGGTVNAGTAGQLAYYGTTSTVVSGNPNLTISSGAVTVGVAGSVVGSVAFSNATSGTIKLQPATGALGSAVLTLPAATGTVAYTIANGAKALATGAISSAACTSAQTDTATGTLTTDTIQASFNGDPTGVTGYIPLTTGMLTIIAYPTADTINFKVCNNTNSSITPGAITINWRVSR